MCGRPFAPVDTRSITGMASQTFNPHHVYRNSIHTHQDLDAVCGRGDLPQEVLHLQPDTNRLSRANVRKCIALDGQVQGVAASLQEQGKEYLNFITRSVLICLCAVSMSEGLLQLLFFYNDRHATQCITHSVLASYMSRWSKELLDHDNPRLWSMLQVTARGRGE